uniref:Uncharacterized protein n=1 Tax=Opuntia streptacantha TaxID=393608 RepID=A0A7C8Z1R0_OPUST
MCNLVHFHNPKFGEERVYSATFFVLFNMKICCSNRKLHRKRLAWSPTLTGIPIFWYALISPPSPAVTITSPHALACIVSPPWLALPSNQDHPWAHEDDEP